MKGTKVVWTSLSIAVWVIPITIIACRGGVDGYEDAGTEGNIMGATKGRSSAGQDACAAAPMVDGDATAENALSDEAGCKRDEE